jgi:threonine dehydrogenase-like Zn-dependent dehydrogenase
LGVANTLVPDVAPLRDFDLVYELTGRPQTFVTAIDAAGFAGRVVVGSWYGNKAAPLLLNTHFHRDRIRIVSSQVSTIAPELSARWSKQRRYDLAWRLLEMLALSALHTHAFPVAEAAQAFAMVDEHPDQAIQVALTYET